jgi:hypothetical protein
MGASIHTWSTKSVIAFHHSGSLYISIFVSRGVSFLSLKNTVLITQAHSIALLFNASSLIVSVHKKLVSKQTVGLVDF